ncbi:hypothetical protein QCA50_003890 [Cerrena zonata]|uniref:Uncharacterized protein n=1 Tax=Cerrena zonata TaxID=2478898 RepID=A0AAW0GFZ8_9APHY
MLSLFDREKQQEKNIRKQVTKESNLITKRSAEIHDQIPEELDHPVLEKVKNEGSKLVEEGDELLEKLGELKTLEKPFKKRELNTLKLEANRYSKGVAKWDKKAIASLDSHRLGYLTSPAQSGATTRNNSASTSSSTANEPYVHPANYWDVALVDRINEAGKTPPVTLIKKRAGESEPDVY